MPVSIQHRPRTFFLAILLIGLAGCRTPGGPVAQVPLDNPAMPEFQREAYTDIEADGRVFWVDSEASEVRLYVWRGGPLAEKGHNHVMRVRNMEGAAFVPDNFLENSLRVDIVFPVRDIEVDPLPLRERLGGAFAGSGMTEKSAAATRDNMLGDKALNAERFPAIGISVRKAIGEPPRLALEVAVALHGIRRMVSVPATLQVEGDQLTATGAFLIQQTRFGIKPFSAMGGALYIENPIMVEFTIVGRANQNG